MNEDALAEIPMPDWHDRPSYVHGWNTAMAAVRAALVRTPETLDVKRGTCWFCKGTFVVDALIAGYDTFEEQRLACLACDERMVGNWRSLAASPAPDPGAGLREALVAKHERNCSCPFDGTDPDCNLTVSGSWLGSWLAPSAEPPETR